MTTTLYRFYDIDDRLLYIGITDNLGRRTKEHAGKPWFSDVVRGDRVEFETREDAADAERIAISTEGPLRNVCHGINNGPRLLDTMPDQLSRDDVLRLSDARHYDEISEAREAGRLNAMLGLRPGVSVRHAKIGDFA